MESKHAVRLINVVLNNRADAKKMYRVNELVLALYYELGVSIFYEFAPPDLYVQVKIR